ncbi:Methylated-DNA--protein-cysteine methyltransferase [Desulfovibrionales bacterium]
MQRTKKALAGLMSGKEYIISKPLALVCHWEKGQLVRLELGWSERQQDGAATLPLSVASMALRESVGLYVSMGRVVWPELPLAWEGLPAFTRRVLERLRADFSSGQTVRYGELAARCGSPGAARAVGQVMATNPWPLVVPCHRVLPASGRVGHFSGAGQAMKIFLLELEGSVPAQR